MNGKGLRHWRAAGLVGLLGVLPFLSTLTAGFVWDDPIHGVDNPAIHRWRPVRFLTVRYWDEEFRWQGLYRPLHALTLATDYALWHRRPAGYHLTNLLLHAAASVAVWWLVWVWSGQRRAALLAGLAFAVLPCHVEAAAWVKNRSIVLMAALCALSAAAFGRGAKGRFEWPMLAAAFAAFAAALCSKPTAVVLPALLAGLAWAVLRGRRRLRALAWTVPFWLGSAAFLLFRKLMFSRGSFAGVPHGPDLTLLQHARLVADTGLFYLHTLLLPVDMGPLHGVALTQPMAAAAAARTAAAAVAAGAAVWLGCRARQAGWVLWAAIALAPVANLSIIAGRPLAEQRLYLLSIGLCACAGCACASRRGRARWLVAACVPLAALCTHQGLAWQSDHRLWEQAVRVAPRAARAQEWRGRTVFDQGRLALAEKHLRRAVQFNPRLAAAWNRLGKIHHRRGDFVAAEQAFQQAIAAQPELPDSHNDLGAFYATLGRWEEAISMLDQALARQSDYPLALTNRARCHLRFGQELADGGRADAAIRHLACARAEPTAPNATRIAAARLQAKLLLGKGRGADALAAAEAGLKLAPRDHELRKTKQAAKEQAEASRRRPHPR